MFINYYSYFWEHDNKTNDKNFQNKIYINIKRLFINIYIFALKFMKKR